jgi:hypothetical protein
MKQRRGSRKSIDIVARSVLASLLLTWGSANLVANVLELLSGNVGPQWLVSMPLIFAFGLIPIGVAVWLIVGLIRKRP